MKRGSKTQGFTVVEAMIFLAVSSVLLVSALLLVGGQQSKTEFNQSIREIQTQIDSIAKDVDTGYYNYPAANFTCATDPITGRPAFDITTTRAQGSNSDCIFIGKAIQFQTGSTNADNYNVYTIAGNRQSGGKEIVKLSDAMPTVIDQGNFTENKKLQYGLEIKKMYYTDDAGGTHNVSSMAFMTTFGSYNSTNLLSSGSKSTNLIAVSGSALGVADSVVVTSIERLSDDPLTNNYVNPKGGITMCFLSQDGNKYGVIKIGGTNGSTATSLTIEDVSSTVSCT